MPKVCLIDDDIYVRDALATGLADCGYDVVPAPGAAAGLDVVAHGGIDAIVTDLNMPGVTGAQLIAETRARWPDLPIVAITGSGSIEGRSAEDIAKALGANACLIKPFRASALSAALERLLTNRGS